MLYNFLSACTCYVGLVLGILLGGMQFGNEYIFALAGGMFLYIALVDMIPELNDATDEAGRHGLASSVKLFCIQNMGIVVGIVSLYVLARFQGDIQIGNM
jgi:zinc transporter ZupT